MIEHRPFNTLGHFQNGWLNARHHFSFGPYRDRARMNWGALRVWNDDQIKAGTGFDPHSHDNMEIITYVRQGAISHQDSLGNHGRTEAGDVQVMSAGSGITHAEYNHESDETRIFQIWIVPRDRGGQSAWQAAQFPKGERSGKFVTLASGNDSEIDAGALPIRQDARVLGATLRKGEETTLTLDPTKYAYLVPARGKATVAGVELLERDGLAIHGETELKIFAGEETEMVLVETV
jgi:quercetin 2,3-dioxygenase